MSEENGIIKKNEFFGGPGPTKITSKDITVKFGFYFDNHPKTVKIAYFLNGDMDDNDQYRPRYFTDGRYESFTFAKIWYIDINGSSRAYLNLYSDAFDGKPDTAVIEQLNTPDWKGQQVQCVTSGYYGVVYFGNDPNTVLTLNYIGSDSD